MHNDTNHWRFGTISKNPEKKLGGTNNFLKMGDRPEFSTPETGDIT